MELERKMVARGEQSGYKPKSGGVEISTIHRDIKHSNQYIGWRAVLRQRGVTNWREIVFPEKDTEDWQIRLLLPWRHPGQASLPR